MLGWDAYRSAVDVSLPEDLKPARVVAAEHGVWTVMTERGPTRVGLSGGMLQQACADPENAPYVGDWVLLRFWCDGRSTLETVLPRRFGNVSESAHRVCSGPIAAANVDVAFVLVPFGAEQPLASVVRRVQVASQDAIPVVVLTKADLSDDPKEYASRVMNALPEVEVVTCSVVDGRGTQVLREMVGHRTGALLGAPGAGRSSLVEFLAGVPVLRHHRSDACGCADPSAPRGALVPLPGGGCLITTN